MRNMLHFSNEMIQEAMDWFELTNRGKLNFTSNDEKKNTGKDPIPMDRFLKENVMRFQPMKQ